MKLKLKVISLKGTKRQKAKEALRKHYHERYHELIKEDMLAGAFNLWPYSKKPKYPKKGVIIRYVKH